MSLTPKWFQIVVGIILFIVIADLAYLNFRFWQVDQKPIATEVIKLPNEDRSRAGDDYLAATIMEEKLQEATAALTQRVDFLSQNSPLPKSIPVTSEITTSGVKEYYIPLGSGSTSATDWTDLTGVEAYVAPSNYGEIKEMYFEASFSGQSGRVFVRLSNVTDNIGLFESEISREGMASALISSGKIPIPTSTKLYRVQMKSAFGAFSTLTNARIKLFVN
ncbi:MAG: hypothetical protein UV61_C0002G0130 [Candidatus Gottesmanbacteria bacterium GW2011_GWB1_43_11]|uniref:Uncharacterized protein n=1 Tax=Candidatus Gottesmanbacteria bacterium GW2011_GWB1_43_11 TaxID=1618446 RepID=A0A0G1CPC6_9BACT|nr:MAG: hypothetical protein UV04_C0001G0018 [Candidatus Gottesmanbacteria bacterium GW2011_GWA2_42_16]KKS56206.1 MAG: hypothetical protein UV17_C0001G0016 [Candidatus Gottesmanbacteria bacterium GW2011_GWA1_42_26]KKS87409.1 MAG: hypothetical protein UV61_C0002G0130 [Candidatus Gottesmanbacteria bacterium GW2011_GWB1_43_11]OGG10216.1 MAG: hypothetical protein A2699_01555 [Candidatus Gottesmanbacteria bacterium RIFCSPHIGHO2_01_FULL_43_15]OGG27666.1 MAG: hypothetical protein A3A59_02665 [Candidat